MKRVVIYAALAGVLTAPLVGWKALLAPDIDGRIVPAADTAQVGAAASAWSDPPRPARSGSGNFNGNGNVGNFNGNGNSGSFNGNGNRSNGNGNGSVRDGAGNGPRGP